MDEQIWNQGAFDDGYAARYVYDQTLDQCPSVDVSGRFYVESWRAGWAEADREILTNGRAGNLTRNPLQA